MAGPDTITIIEQVKNDEGQSFFNLSNEVFVSTAPQAFTSASTFVAKSGDFLVVKQSNRRNLGLMPIC